MGTNWQRPLRSPVACAVTLGALAGGIGLTPRPTAAQSFTGLGFLPDGGYWSEGWAVATGGSTVVGYCFFQPSGWVHAFRWTDTGGMQDLGTLPPNTVGAWYGHGVSADGSVAVGDGDSGAFRWTSGTGMQAIGMGGGFGISADASAIVGFLIHIGPSGVPYRVGTRWTGAGGIRELGLLPGRTDSWALAVSGDGAVVTGSGFSPSVMDRAFRWTNAGGMIALETNNSVIPRIGRAISADGSVIVGIGESSAGTCAFRWTVSGGTVSLGTLPSGVYSFGFGVGADGATAVGYSATPNGDHAFLWDSARGMVDLNVYLPALSINLTGWTLTAATAVGADGRSITGYGRHNGATEAWVATLGPVCYANCDRSTAAPVLNSVDFACFLNAFAAGDPYANCDQSTTPPTLNVADFACFLNRFAAGCS